MLGAGVYALIYAEEVVYVGRAKDLITRIYSHRNVWKRFKKGVRLPTNVKPILFSRFVYWPCGEFDLDRLEREMIAKYRPKHNTLLKPKVSLSGFVVNGVIIGRAPMEQVEFVRRV